MKTKLPSSSNSSTKRFVKCHGILSFLIILFMTVSSFGQSASDGITFTCTEGNVVFGASDGITNGYISWTDPGNDFSLYYNTLNSINRWEVYGPDGSGDILYFFSSTIVNDLPSCEAGNWTAGTGITCSNFSIIGCSDPDNDGDGYTVSQGDCDDNDAEEFPGQTWYTDSDGDGFGNMDDTGTISCEKPGGLVSNNDDCDDTNSDIYSGAPEVCDGFDNNCDGNIDEGLTDCDDDQDVYEYCGNVSKQNKVIICHKGKDKCVNINALDAHLGHGDTLGSCSAKSVNRGKAELAEIVEELPTNYDVAFWPNPSNSNFNVKLITPNITEKVSIEAYDINGRLMHSNIINGNENYQFGNNLSSGIYIVKLTQESTTKMIKVVKQ